MLDGVHRYPRPWPDIHVAVVQRMGKLVQRRQMQRPVYPVEME